MNDNNNEVNNNESSNKTKKGITLTEILCVIGIAGIVAGAIAGCFIKKQ